MANKRYTNSQPLLAIQFLAADDLVRGGSQFADGERKKVVLFPILKNYVLGGKTVAGCRCGDIVE